MSKKVGTRKHGFCREVAVSRGSPVYFFGYLLVFRKPFSFRYLSVTCTSAMLGVRTMKLSSFGNK